MPHHVEPYSQLSATTQHQPAYSYTPPHDVQHNYPATYDLPCCYWGGYMYTPQPLPTQYHHANRNPQPHPAHEKHHHHAQCPPPPFLIPHGGYIRYSVPAAILSQPMVPMPSGPGGGSDMIQVVHTDKAAAKLSDHVRRRCFNCCTTDTKTWRRSNLSPGKVLCNKCGLFERNHSRPRPEQIIRRRYLSCSTIRSCSPPQQAQPIHQITPQYAPPPPGIAAPTTSPNPNSGASYESPTPSLSSSASASAPPHSQPQSNGAALR